MMKNMIFTGLECVSDGLLIPCVLEKGEIHVTRMQLSLHLLLWDYFQPALSSPGSSAPLPHLALDVGSWGSLTKRVDLILASEPPPRSILILILQNMQPCSRPGWLWGSVAGSHWWYMIWICYTSIKSANELLGMRWLELVLQPWL